MLQRVNKWLYSWYTKTSFTWFWLNQSHSGKENFWINRIAWFFLVGSLRYNKHTDKKLLATYYLEVKLLLWLHLKCIFTSVIFLSLCENDNKNIDEVQYSVFFVNCEPTIGPTHFLITHFMQGRISGYFAYFWQHFCAYLFLVIQPFFVVLFRYSYKWK